MDTPLSTRRVRCSILRASRQSVDIGTRCRLRPRRSAPSGGPTVRPSPGRRQRLSPPGAPGMRAAASGRHHGRRYQRRPSRPGAASGRVPGRRDKVRTWTCVRRPHERVLALAPAVSLQLGRANPLLRFRFASRWSAAETTDHPSQSSAGNEARVSILGQLFSNKEARGIRSPARSPASSAD